MTITHKSRLCKVCSAEYLPTGPAQRYCATCGEIKREEAYEREKAKLRNGLGKGYWVKLGGVFHPGYKNGIGSYKRTRDEKLVEQGYKCAKCQKDLRGLSYSHWCGHHIDHDRTNNDPSNIEAVCKRCHQVEHKCWENFLEGATTIPKGSTRKCVEAPSPRQG